MLVSREFTFSAAHKLPGYGGKCEKLHGHTWRLRVTVRCAVENNGIALDFTDLAKVVNEKVVNTLDHSSLNDLLPQPSAERIAQWTWERLKELNLYEVRVWESNSSFVSYRGEGDSA